MFLLILLCLPFSLWDHQVFLLPSVLARKRIWNKKYPICIVLAEGAGGREKAVEEEVMEEEEEEKGDKHPLLSDSESDLPTTLYLFGRTGREKEEWFQHFLSASKGDIHSKLRRDESQTGEHRSSVYGQKIERDSQSVYD